LGSAHAWLAIAYVFLVLASVAFLQNPQTASVDLLDGCRAFLHSLFCLLVACVFIAVNCSCGHDTTTPMMKQYEEAKRACPGPCCCFAWRLLRDVSRGREDGRPRAQPGLTSRDKGENGTPMAGFPTTSWKVTWAKLIASGFRAAVCEQVEDPKAGQGTRQTRSDTVVTPGTITDDALLDPRESNYLAAVSPATRSAWPGWNFRRAASWRPIFPAAQLPDQLARIAPAECLAGRRSPPLPRHLDEKMLVHAAARLGLLAGTARQNLLKHFHTNNLEASVFTNEPGDDQASAPPAP